MRAPSRPAHLAVRLHDEPHERGSAARDVRPSTQHSWVAGGDPGEDAARDGAVLNVEEGIAVVVDSCDHRRYERQVGRIDHRLVERLVGQRVGVERPQRLGAADRFDQITEEVELSPGERVVLIDRDD